MKKKIIFMSYSLCFGGIEKALIELLNKLDYSKYDVTLLLEKKEGDFLAKLNKNVKIYNYDICNSKNVLYRKFRNGLKRLKYLMFNYMKYDFACCYATYSKPCSLLSLKSSKNTALYVHGDYVNEFNDNKKTIDFFQNQDIEKFKKVIFVSNESRDNLIKLMPQITNKSYVINNIINNSDIIKLSNEKINETKRKDTILLLYVGRLDEKVKRISKMILTTEFLNKNNIHTDFWIIGDGEDYQLYEKIIKEKKLQNNVKLLGSKINPYPYIKLCDYLVITSDHEGFPVTCLEAMCLNKNIISTISVSDDEIDIKDYAYIISKDVDKMKNEVLKIVNSKNKLKEVDFNTINKKRIKKLEAMFEGEFDEV